MVDVVVEKPAPGPWFSRFFRRGDTEHLSPGQLIAFGLPAFPVAAMVAPLGFYLAPYFTGELGITLSTWGLIIGITRIGDMLTDPVVGMICDRLPSRWGRRRHWIVASAPFLMISCAILFTPQYFTQHVTFWYVLVGLILFNLATTVQGLNSTAWGGELSVRYEERSRIMGWRAIIAGFAQLSAFSIPAAMELLIPGATTGDKLEALMWAAVMLTPITVFVAVISVGEKPIEEVQAKERQTFGLGEIIATLKRMVTNKYLLWLVVVDVLRSSPNALKTALFVFYVTYIMEAPHMTATVLLGVYIATIIMTPIWMRLSRGREKHKLLAVAIFIFGCSQATSMFWGPDQLWWFVAFTFVNGATSGGSSFLTQSIMADVVDSDVLKSGKQQTGAFFAVLETTTKLAPTLAVIAVFPALEAFGFDPSGKNNSQQALDAVRYIYALAPAAPTILAAIFLWNFPLGSKQQGELRAQIDAARQGQSRDTPPA